MRIRLHKYLRFVLMIFSIAVLVTVSIMLCRELKVPKYKEEKVVLYSYDQKTDVKYRVFLKPNVVYDKDNLEEGQSYLSGFVDYIRTYFTYEFAGQTDAEIVGNYRIVAAVEGYTVEEKKVKVIWKKEYTLTPKTEFKTKDKKLKIEKEVPLKLEEFNGLVEQVKQTAKVNIPARVLIFMDMNVNAITNKGEIKEKFKPLLEIPLGEPHFQVVKSGIEEKPGVIEKTQKIQLPPNEMLINLYGGIIGFVIILLSCLIGFTSSAQVDPITKKLNSIFKKHGNRLVALNTEVAVTCEVGCQVKSIDDLVKIADELGKPILYQYSEEPKEITQFCVYDDTCTYAYNIEDTPMQLMQSKSKLEKEREIKVNISKTKEDEIMN